MENIRSLPADLTADRQDGERYSVTIAANAEVGDGVYIDPKRIDVSQYMRNPVVLWAHDRRNVPIGRTKSMELTADGRLRADFEFLPGDTFAQRVRNAWDRGFIRGASVGVLFDKDGDFTTTPRLKEWSLTSVPLDPDALRSAHDKLVDSVIFKRESDSPSAKVPEMDEREIKDLVDRTVSEHVRSDEKPDGDQLATRLVETFQRAMNDVLKDRDEQRQAAVAARAEKTELENRMREAVAARTDLLLATRSLLGENVKTETMTDSEILRAAVGEEVSDAANRTDDYLRGALDQILKRRALAHNAGDTNPRTASVASFNQSSRYGIADLVTLREAKS